MLSLSYLLATFSGFSAKLAGMITAVQQLAATALAFHNLQNTQSSAPKSDQQKRSRKMLEATRAAGGSHQQPVAAKWHTAKWRGNVNKKLKLKRYYMQAVTPKILAPTPFPWRMTPTNQGKHALVGRRACIGYGSDICRACVGHQAHAATMNVLNLLTTCSGTTPEP